MGNKNKELDSISTMTILCVDDEVSILRALKRLFYNKNYQVILTDTAEKALEILKEKNIQLIISDMKMPGMDGASFLEQAAMLYPQTYRIVLTGYADLESTIAAVNLGKISRFVSKPWDNSELITIVDEYLERIKLKAENTQLRKEVEKQNEQLLEWNHKLENTVELRTKQIRMVLKQQEINTKVTEKMLFNFIAINPNLNAQFAKNVGNLSGRIAMKMGLDKKEIHDIRLAGFLNEIGMLGIEAQICKTPFNELNYEQKKVLRNQSKIAQQILSPAQHLNHVTDIICHQFDSFEKISSLDIVTQRGCKILMIARDYCRYAYGKIVSKQLTFEQIIKELNKGIDIRYDNNILMLLTNNPSLIEDTMTGKGFKSSQLAPGMVLKHNLFSVNHLLILAEGHVFNPHSIQKLMEYEKNQKHVFEIEIEIEK